MHNHVHVREVFRLKTVITRMVLLIIRITLLVLETHCREEGKVNGAGLLLAGHYLIV